MPVGLLNTFQLGLFSYKRTHEVLKSLAVQVISNSNLVFFFFWDSEMRRNKCINNLFFMPTCSFFIPSLKVFLSSTCSSHQMSFFYSFFKYSFSRPVLVIRFPFLIPSLKCTFVSGLLDVLHSSCGGQVLVLNGLVCERSPEGVLSISWPPFIILFLLLFPWLLCQHLFTLDRVMPGHRGASSRPHTFFEVKRGYWGMMSRRSKFIVSLLMPAPFLLLGQKQRLLSSTEDQ